MCVCVCYFILRPSIILFQGFFSLFLFFYYFAFYWKAEKKASGSPIITKSSVNIPYVPNCFHNPLLLILIHLRWCRRRRHVVVTEYSSTICFGKPVPEMNTYVWVCSPWSLPLVTGTPIATLKNSDFSIIYRE